MKKYFLLILLVFMISCNRDKIIYEGNWKTTYKVYYTSLSSETKTIYTENEVYVCSFNGTNYLIEKDNPEELFSTTAPIKIINTEELEK